MKITSVDHNWLIIWMIVKRPKKYQRLTQFLEKNKIGEERAQIYGIPSVLGKDPGVVLTKSLSLCGLSYPIDTRKE